MKLVLRERGATQAVSLEDWHNLRLEETVGALARDGIVRVERTNAAILLTPRNYVGEMRASNATLTILPKDEALYNAIKGLAVRFDSKHAQHHDLAFVGKGGDDLVTPFVESLAKVLEEGVPWQYVVKEEATSQPRGKPNFGKTITQFVSRGVMHKIVAKHQERRQIRPLVNVVWAAYRCLPTAPGTTPLLVSKSSLLVGALEPQDVFRISEIVVGVNEILGGKLLSSNGESLVMAALSILNNERAAGRNPIFLPAGVAHFANLERVWERAVACLVAEAVQASGQSTDLHGLALEGLRLFGHDGPTIDPDVVVKSAAGNVSLIADAKYKVLTDNEAGGIASDIYQLTCYVNRTQASSGLLVYLGGNDSALSLGDTDHGAQIAVVRISAGSLVSHGHNALARLLSGQGRLR